MINCSQFVPYYFTYSIIAIIEVVSKDRKKICWAALPIETNNGHLLLRQSILNERLNAEKLSEFWISENRIFKTLTWLFISISY